MTLHKLRSTDLAKRITCFAFSLGLFALILVGCEEDYQPFDTEPAFEIGKPKIRFVNLHFNEKEVTLNIGSDRLIKTLSYEELSAYEEAPDYLIDSNTPFTVHDTDGELLLQDTLLSLKEGNNYTLFIIPSYSGAFTDYQSSSNPASPTRYMVTVNPNQAKAALTQDPISSSLADRATVRQVSFDPARVNNRNNTGSAYFLSDAEEFLQAPPQAGFSDFTPSRTDDVPDFSSSDAYVNFGYAVASPGNYRLYYGFATTLATFSPSQSENGKSYGLVANQPNSFLAGKSYTIVSNGSVGESNDVSYLVGVRGPLPLKPIPSVVYVLDDTDGTARKLVPVTLGRLADYKAILCLFDLNYLWRNTNPGSFLNLAIQGLVPDRGRMEGGNNNSFETQKFGNQTVEIVPQNLARPAISSATADLAANGKYFVFHYVDKDNTAKTKIIQPDTTVNYGATIKVNFANFSPDLEPVEVINIATQEVLIPALEFTELSKSIELSVDRSFIGQVAVETVPKLAVVRPATKEILFEIDLAPQNNFNGFTNLILNLGGQNNSGIIYTIILSGRYQSTSDMDRFEKRVFAFERADKPTTSEEDVFNWKLVYELLL